MVIEVRFIDPGNGEVLDDKFTATSPKNWDKFDHTAMHRESIELALHAWSGGAGVLKDIKRTMGPAFTGSGNVTAWKYIYDCTLAGPPEDVEDERLVLAVLFAEYSEKQKSERTTP